MSGRGLDAVDRCLDVSGRGLDARTDLTLRVASLGQLALDRVSGAVLGRRLGTGPVLWLTLQVGPDSPDHRRGCAARGTSRPAVFAVDRDGADASGGTTPPAGATTTAETTPPLVVAAPGQLADRAAGWVAGLRAHVARGVPVGVRLGTRFGGGDGDLDLLARVEELPPGPDRDRCHALLAETGAPGCSPEQRRGRPAAVFRLVPVAGPAEATALRPPGGRRRRPRRQGC